MLSPQRTRFRKQHSERMKGISYRGNHICFERYALQALEPAWITSRQIEQGDGQCHEMSAGVDKYGFAYFQTNRLQYIRPTEMRMGSRKGSPVYWVAIVKPGRMLYKMGEVAENIARKAISITT